MDVHRLQVLRYCLPQSVSDSGLFYNHITARLVPTIVWTVRVSVSGHFCYRWMSVMCYINEMSKAASKLKETDEKKIELFRICAKNV